MIGTNAATGKRLSGTAHLAQSIADILMTPLGSRVMRPDYGSLLPDLIDQPFNGTTRLRMFGAIAGALGRWEPRISITRLGLTLGTAAGAFVLDLEGTLADSASASELTRLSIPLTTRT